MQMRHLKHVPTCLSFNNTVMLNGKPYTVVDNTLMYTMDGTDVEFMDIDDLDEGMNVKYILNTDNEILYLEVVPTI